MYSADSYSNLQSRQMMLLPRMEGFGSEKERDDMVLGGNQVTFENMAIERSGPKASFGESDE